ncbi:MAG: segregation/condensation protein A [Caldilineaceae bacterium]
MTITLQPRTLGSAYPVELPAFQGPVDLLLQLIEKQELEITQVSLVAVTDSYLRTIEQLEEIEPGALADFLVIASKLIYLKSRSLLPQPRPPEEDEDEEEAGDALVRQLIEYRQFKEVANLLKAREDLGLRAYVRTEALPKLEKRLDLSNLSLTKLQAALRKVLQRIPTDPPLPTVKTYPITLAQQIDTVRKLVRDAVDQFSAVRRSSQTDQDSTKVHIGFIELLSRSQTRMEVIVTFLAVLELIKQEELVAEQNDTFGEIVLVPLKI